MRHELLSSFDGGRSCLDVSIPVGLKFDLLLYLKIVLLVNDLVQHQCSSTVLMTFVAFKIGELSHTNSYDNESKFPVMILHIAST